MRAEALTRAATPVEEDMTSEQARQLAELHAALTAPQPGFNDPGGTALNAAWAALWGYYMIIHNLNPALVDIQNRLTELET
jgi:hypothetical protein